MACHDVDFVAFDFATELNGGLLGVHHCSQGSGHALSVILVDAEFGCYLQVRQIQTHKVKAQNPCTQRLMVALKDGFSQVVEVGATTFAMISLPIRLGLIAAISGNIGA